MKNVIEDFFKLPDDTIILLSEVLLVSYVYEGYYTIKFKHCEASVSVKQKSLHREDFIQIWQEKTIKQETYHR
jgi:hypothetical protein